jgi:hypothetical protein
MRIDPVFTVGVAITLVAVTGIESDGSGLTHLPMRSAQLGQLAQTPKPSPSPTGQPGPESSTSARGLRPRPLLRLTTLLPVPRQ